MKVVDRFVGVWIKICLGYFAKSMIEILNYTIADSIPEFIADKYKIFES